MLSVGTFHWINVQGKESLSQTTDWLQGQSTSLAENGLCGSVYPAWTNWQDFCSNPLKSCPCCRVCTCRVPNFLLFLLLNPYPFNLLRQCSGETATIRHRGMEVKTMCEPSAGHWAPRHLLPAFLGYMARLSPEVPQRSVPCRISTLMP